VQAESQWRKAICRRPRSQPRRSFQALAARSAAASAVAAVLKRFFINVSIQLCVQVRLGWTAYKLNPALYVVETIKRRRWSLTVELCEEVIAEHVSPPGRETGHRLLPGEELRGSGTGSGSRRGGSGGDRGGEGEGGQRIQRYWRCWCWSSLKYQEVLEYPLDVVDGQRAEDEPDWSFNLRLRGSVHFCYRTHLHHRYSNGRPDITTGVLNTSSVLSMVAVTQRIVLWVSLPNVTTIWQIPYWAVWRSSM